MRIGSRTELWNKLMDEVELGHVAGPYNAVPFPNYIQSPIGSVPKAGSNKTRLIFHLSYNFGEKEEQKTLNYHTPKSKCTVTYRDMDDTIRACLSAQKELDELDETGPIFLAKADAKSAFRILPLRKSSWPWLVMFAHHPETGKIQYFMDKCLPFGASISCALFQKFSNALCFMIHYRTNSPQRRITNYLDDFLFVACTLLKCNRLVQLFMEMCEELGVPIAHEKTEWGCIQLVFLGILMDGEYLILGIPEDKRTKAINLLTLMVSKKKATVKELQALCGYLNFITKAVFPGKAFTQRMYSKYVRIVKVHLVLHKSEEANDTSGGIDLRTSQDNEFCLKEHHHVRLDKEFKADCEIWLKFLTHNELRAMVN